MHAIGSFQDSGSEPVSRVKAAMARMMLSLGYATLVLWALSLIWWHDTLGFLAHRGSVTGARYLVFFHLLWLQRLSS